MSSDTSSADDAHPRAHTWYRWTERPDVPFHRFCEVLPVRFENGSIVWNTEPSANRPDVQYTSGLVRLGLRFTPTLLLLYMAIVYLGAEFSSSIVGFTDLVAVPSTVPTWAIAVFVGWAVLLLYLIYKVDIVALDDLSRDLFIYGFMGALLAGVAYSVWVVSTNGDWSGALPADSVTGNVVFGSGYFLLLLLGGQYVYDGMLRTENMFTRLHRKPKTIVSDPEAYEREFLQEFIETLDARLQFDAGRLPGPFTGTLSVRTVYAFSFVFVVPFIASGFALNASKLGLPIETYLVTHWIDASVLVLSTLMNAFMVIVFFQFLVLIAYFHDLLTTYRPGTDSDTSFKLEYRPKHPDGYAGFKDIGKFATRVNVLLIIAGIYSVNRLYVHGVRAFPESAPAVSGEVLNWGFNFVGPVVVYAIAVVVWLYFSFWQIHRTMSAGREREVARLVTGEDAIDDASFEQHTSGPVWPLNTRMFVTMLSVDMLPLLTAIPALRL